MKIRISGKTRFPQSLLLIIALLVILLSCCSKQKTVINLNSEEENLPTKENHPLKNPEVLNVAIGAMLSPESTNFFYTEILEIVAEAMNCRLSVHQRRTYEEINTLVENRTVDLAFVCTGAYVSGNEKFGMELLVMPVSNGDIVYYSYFISNIESDIKLLSDLRNKTFAFTDPESNTGHLSPQYILSQISETKDSFFKDYFFTYSHDNSIKAVAKGLADGAAVDSLIWEYLKKEEDSDTVSTKIIHKSEPYGIPPVVIHPDLDTEMKIRLKEIFLMLHENDDAALKMKKINIDKFIEGDDSNYNTVRDMRNWISKSITGLPNA